MLANMIASIAVVIFPIYMYLLRNKIGADTRLLTKKQIHRYIIYVVIVGGLLSHFSIEYVVLRISLLPLLFSIVIKYFGWKVTMPSLLVLGVCLVVVEPVLRLWPIIFIYLVLTLTLYPLQVFLEKEWDEFSQLFAIATYVMVMLTFLFYFITSDTYTLMMFYFISSLFNYIMIAVLYFVIKDFRYLHERIDYDYLTRLLNVRRFKERLLALEDKRNLPLTIAVMDIDWFKSFNDSYGHDAGDKILGGVSQVFAAYSTEEVTPYRIGGEEFAIITKKLTLEEAELIIADIMDNVVNRPIPIGRDHSVSVTLSVGLVFVQDDETMSEAWVRADQAMYTAKQNGRDQLFVDRQTCAEHKESKSNLTPASQIQ